MRSYKTIERPAQVLGMNLMDLGLIVGLLLGSILLLGVVSMVIHVPRIVYLFVLVVTIGLFILFRYLNKHRPPGFLMGWLSFTFIQPRRISLGQLPTANEKSQNYRV